MTRDRRPPPDDVARRVSRLTRRNFFVAAAAAAAGYGGWRWLMSRELEGGIQWPFRRVLEWNERISGGLVDAGRLSPEFPVGRAAANPRVNGHIGLDPRADPSGWRVRIDGSLAGEGVELALDEIRALPRHEMVTEFHCIEGWSMIVHWTGARLLDLMRRFPPPPSAQYVSLETPGRQYYVGLDMPSAMHPQTLLAYEINRKPLTWNHGAPLRLAIPVKYGIKNIKRIGRIAYTAERPADFWAERGYDWFAGQ